ncbi:MAG: hypothetical protein Phog2KO_14150 [Phototrophicaceae bacterium]
MLNWLLEPFQLPFMQTALIAAVLVGIPSAVIGCYVVLRRMAFIGNALSHTVLPGLVIAFMNNWSLPLGAMVAGIFTSLGIGWLSKNQEIRDDTAIGVIFTAMFALGLLLISTTDSLRDLNNMLFGNILGVTDEKLWIVAGIAIVVLLGLIIFHKELELSSVDPIYAQVIGINPDRMRFFLLVLLALTVVSSIQIVGVVLTSAMLITPAASAGLLTKRLPLMMGIASFFAVASGVIGLYISYYADTSSGAAIVLSATGFFALSWLISVAPSWMPETAQQFINTSKAKHKLPAIKWQRFGFKGLLMALIPVFIISIAIIPRLDFESETVLVSIPESEILSPVVVMAPTAIPTASATILNVSISDTDRLFYLAPAYDAPRNIWMVELDDLDNPQQITDSAGGILDFALHQDGTRIVFSENDPNFGTYDIKLLNLETGAIRRLTDCQGADCITPIWHPNGDLLVYERIDFDISAATGSHAGHNHGTSQAIPSIWFIDFSVPNNPTGPLFPEQQLEAFGVQWSQDGGRMMMLDVNMTGIFVYDFSSDNLQRFETGVLGGRSTTTFSPDGTSIIYSKVVFTDQTMRTQLYQISVDEETIVALSEDEILADDDMPRWSPDGRYVAIARRYSGEEEGANDTRQVYLIDTVSNDIYPISFDSRYTNGFFEWNADGTQLMILRLEEFLENGDRNPQWYPELWVYDLESEELSLLVHDALNGRWTR